MCLFYHLLLTNASLRTNKYPIGRHLMPSYIEEPLIPPNVSEGQIRLLKANICQSSPFKYYNLLFAINNRYVRQRMSQRGMNLLGFAWFVSFFPHHLPVDDGDYCDQDNVEIDARLDENKYVYRMCINNTLQKNTPKCGVSYALCFAR